MRGQLGVVEGVPSRFSLFLPSDPQIGPGNAASVSANQSDSCNNSSSDTLIGCASNRGVKLSDWIRAELKGSATWDNVPAAH